MKQQTSKFRLFIVLASLPLAGILAVGCSSPQKMRSSVGVPASEGIVTVREASNGDTHLTVTVKHLARPENVVAGARSYVVWIQADERSDQSVGTLALDGNLGGSVDAITPHRRFMLRVTPEANSQVAKPANEPVLSFYVDR